MNSATVQSYVRRVLLWLTGVLAGYGYFKADASWIQPAISALTTLAAFAWSIYGTRLSGLLAQIQGKDGVVATSVIVDPEKINPASVNSATPDGVTAKAEAGANVIVPKTGAKL